MPTAVNTILRSAHRGEKLNILTAPTHERYETGLAKTGQNFYAWQGEHIKGWNETYAKVPNNYILLNPNLGNQQIPLDLDMDLCLSQNKFGQFQIMHNISRQLGCPLISLEHTLPPDNWTNAQLIPHREMKGDLNIFISEYSRDKWGWTAQNAHVIHHGVDTEVFCPENISIKQPLVCSVVNDWVNRNWCCNFELWKQCTGYPNSKFQLNVWGDTPGLSKPTRDVNHLVNELRRSQVFINTSSISPVPTSLLEAMACGTPVVSSATCMIPEILENNKNGFLSNDPDELRFYIEKLLSSKDLRDRIGIAGRETILKRFSMNKFIENWGRAFNSLL